MVSEFSRTSDRKLSSTSSSEARNGCEESDVADDIYSRVVIKEKEELAVQLLNYFNQKNLDAVERCIKDSLESIRKHMTASMMAKYGECKQMRWLLLSSDRTAGKS